MHVPVCYTFSNLNLIFSPLKYFNMMFSINFDFWFEICSRSKFKTIVNSLLLYYLAIQLIEQNLHELKHFTVHDPCFFIHGRPKQLSRAFYCQTSQTVSDLKHDYHKILIFVWVLHAKKFLDSNVLKSYVKISKPCRSSEVRPSWASAPSERWLDVALC